MQTEHGPLEDIPASQRSREWPPSKVARLVDILPSRSQLASRRFKSCAVVGSSPELLMYSDGEAIDAHDAVFRANLAVVDGFEEYAGRRTSVRVINPVESVKRARAKGARADRDETIVIKNQDPPAIRSPSREHAKFLEEATKERRPDSASADGTARAGRDGTLYANYLARRGVLELCNYLMLASIDADAAEMGSVPAAPKPKKRDKASHKHKARQLNFSEVTDSFRRFAAGRTSSWHPDGDQIPRFSPSHCSTGTVLLVQALLMCESVSLYGYHACSCSRRCSEEKVANRNHYWDKKETPRFGEMMSRYEHHMLFYQRLERSCAVNFRIARRDHCDAPRR